MSPAWNSYNFCHSKCQCYNYHSDQVYTNVYTDEENMYTDEEMYTDEDMYTDNEDMTNNSLDANNNSKDYRLHHKFVTPVCNNTTSIIIMGLW